MIWTTAFWKGAGERALKTYLQVFSSYLIAGAGAEAVGITAGLADVSWLQGLSVAALATVISLMFSIGNADFTAGVGNVEDAARIRG